MAEDEKETAIEGEAEQIIDAAARSEDAAPRHVLPARDVRAALLWAFSQAFRGKDRQHLIVYCVS